MRSALVGAASTGEVYIGFSRWSGLADRMQISGFPPRDSAYAPIDHGVAMNESRLHTPDEPYALPRDAATRRMAISTLSFRAIAQRREMQLNDVLGDEHAELLSDLMAHVTNETSTQLMLTEHLLKEGWAWERILAAVWYNEEFLRGAATAE